MKTAMIIAKPSPSRTAAARTRARLSSGSSPRRLRPRTVAAIIARNRISQTILSMPPREFVNTSAIAIIAEAKA